MIHIICPPFVEGNNLRYLTDSVTEVLEMYSVTYNLYHYIGPNVDLPKRRTRGFYNMDTWMVSDANVVSLVSTHIKNGDKIFFIDLWSPAVIHLKAHCLLNNLDVKFIGWYHGSSTLEGDFLAVHFDAVARNSFYAIEQALYSCYDLIWYGSDFFKSGIPNNVSYKKLLKTGEPFKTSHYAKYRNTDNDNKTWDVIVPFRLDKDKIDIKFLGAIIEMNPDLVFLIESPVHGDVDIENKLLAKKNVQIKIGVDDKQHIMDLSQSRVVFSTALQEGWGYAVLKAITVGCIPVLPNRAVYKELYDTEYLYTTEGYANKLINMYVEHYPIKAFIPPDYSMREAVNNTFIKLL